jgi:anti-anti-sigma factor
MFHADLLHPESHGIGDLIGEIDMATAPGVEDALLAAVLSAPGPTARVECGGMTFIDSSGIHMLEHVARRSDKTVRLVNVGGASRRVFEILDLCETYGLDDTGHD